MRSKSADAHHLGGVNLFLKNAGFIDMFGDGEKSAEAVRRAASFPGTKAIVIRINSGGKPLSHGFAELKHKFV